MLRRPQRYSGIDEMLPHLNHLFIFINSGPEHIAILVRIWMLWHEDRPGSRRTALRQPHHLRQFVRFSLSVNFVSNRFQRPKGVTRHRTSICQITGHRIQADHLGGHRAAGNIKIFFTSGIRLSFIPLE